MKILWIVQKDLAHDLDSATWIESSKILSATENQVVLCYAAQNRFTNGNKLLKKNGRAIRVINLFPFLSLSFHLQIFFQIFYFLFSDKPDVVITHPITALIIAPAVLLSKLFRLKTKFVLDVRTLPVGCFGISGKIKKRFIFISIYVGNKLFDGLTVITPALKELLVEKFKVQSEKIGIWGSGVNPELFQAGGKKQASPKKAFTLLYHGVLAENRGILEAVQAMELVAKEFVNVEFIIVGNGPGRDKIENLINERKLRGCVKLLPPVPQTEIPNYIEAADCGILPLPDFEFWRISSPLKLFEYLAMSRPVIVSPIEAHLSVLKNNSAGIFLKSVSPKEIAETILATYENFDKLPRWGELGRKLVLDNYTWQKQAEKLSLYLKNLYQMKESK